MHRLLAIDPGINGSSCLFVCGAVVPVEPGGLIDLPTIGADKQREIDALNFRDWMLQMQPDSAIIEQVTPMPSIPDKKTGERRSMGATSAFAFGGTYKVLKAIPLLFNIPTAVVPPARWKKHFKLRGGLEGKEQARQLALQKWPCMAPFLKFKNTADRAEAMLIALFHWETELRG
jgi:crossover junction endodeoxyribonuclease RuvC